MTHSQVKELVAATVEERTPICNAVVHPPTAEGISSAAECLRRGDLVAFPTETVYGLGADARDEAAVRRIFAVKGRPLTDPLIVHVPTPEAALELLQIEGEGLTVFRLLAEQFWPGALTLVGKAKEILPMCVTAGTGFVGVRCPSHPIAQQLLRISGVPIAAPSANRFGHVSPTTAQHVLNDLGGAFIGVLDGDHQGAGSGDFKQSTTCELGIESTVCKVDSERQRILLYRRGAVSRRSIEKALEASGHAHFVVEVCQKIIKPSMTDSAGHPKDIFRGNDGNDQVTAEGHQAPGQLISHYAPDVPTFILRVTEQGAVEAKSDVQGHANSKGDTGDTADVMLTKAIVLDFGNRLSWLEGRCLAYSNLSARGDAREAARVLFRMLRWAEGMEGQGAAFVVLPDLFSGPEVDDEHLEALADRLFRAASGRVEEVIRGKLPSLPLV